MAATATTDPAGTTIRESKLLSDYFHDAFPADPAHFHLQTFWTSGKREQLDPGRCIKVQQSGEDRLTVVGMRSLPRKSWQRGEAGLRARVPRGLHKAVVQERQYLPLLQSNCLN